MSPDPSQPPRYLEITSTDRKRRWFGTAGYALFFAAVATAIYLLFSRFTGSVVLATVLVGFMVTYMAVMGWLASRNAHRRE
jgi:hypothetical protein